MRKTIARLSLLCTLIATVAGAATNRNDDSCDIAVMPAATLLLPYFEVDLAAQLGQARTTLFTITNTTNTPQIAKVTIWSDWSWPVMDFHVYLTGYDVQAINLWDVLARGVLPGTLNNSTPGSRSLATNARFAQDAASTCAQQARQLPANILADMQNTLRTGAASQCGTARVGGENSPLATGFATIDLVSTCRSGFITSAATFDTLLFDNVVTGDWQLINPDAANGNLASGSPLVHIRAIPEGGNAGERVDTNLPYTFYDRFGGPFRRGTDRRQPLPSSFGARYIQGGASGFNTQFLIWREGRTAPVNTCGDYEVQNGRLPVSGLVRFDDRENPTSSTTLGTTATTTRLASTNTLFPPLTSGDVAGWMVFNLDNGSTSVYGVAPGRDFRTGSSSVEGPRPSQNWVVGLLLAEGRYSAAREATALANGCSPSPASGTNIPVLGPGPNPTP
jgi:hypothetical protein